MFPYDHGTTLEVATGFTLLVAFVWLVRYARRGQGKKAAACTVLSVPAIVLAILFLLHGSMVFKHNRVTAIVYAPDRKHAAVVTRYEGLLTGADTDSVKLLSHGGMSAEDIVGTDPYALEAENLIWTDNANLTVNLHEAYLYACNSAQSVHVVCKQDQGAPGR